jgi:hypothetical protein
MMPPLLRLKEPSCCRLVHVLLLLSSPQYDVQHCLLAPSGQHRCLMCTDTPPPAAAAAAAAAGWCMCCCLPQIRQLSVSFASNLSDALPGHVQRVIRCMTQLSSACSSHAELAWVEWQPPVLQAMMQHLMANRWAGPAGTRAV